MLRIESDRRPFEVVDTCVQAIDLYFDNILEYPDNTVRVTSRDESDDGQVIQSVYTIKRVYDTAYFICCERASLETWGGDSPVMASPIGKTEFRFLPSLFEAGKISVRHQSADSNLVEDAEVSLDDLERVDPTAAGILKTLELNLLCLLVGHSTQRPLFDTLPGEVKSLLEKTYGKDIAADLWAAGMSK